MALAGLACEQEGAAAPQSAASGDHAFYWTAAAGTFRVNENSDLFGADRDQLLLSGGMAQRKRQGLSLDFQLLLYEGRIDAPPSPPPIFGSIADHYDLTAGLMAFGVQWEVPRGPVRPFGGATGGVYLTKIKRTGQVFGIPGTVDEERDVSPALSLDAGFAFILAPKHSLTLKYRRLFAKVHLDAISPDDVDLGGGAVLLGYRHAFDFIPPSPRSRP